MPLKALTIAFLALSCGPAMMDFTGKTCGTVRDCPLDYACIENAPGKRTCQRLSEYELSRRPMEPAYYCGDVAPLFQKYCSDCHDATPSPDAPQEFRIDVYDDVSATVHGAKTYAAAIRSRVMDLSMPPPPLDGPTDEERELILRWAVNDAPLGPPGVTCSTGEPSNDNAVLSAVLYNADTDQIVPGFNPIPASAIIDFSNLGTRNLSILANAPGPLVQSVRFVWDNVEKRIENLPPYTWNGDSGTDFQPIPSTDLTIGTHTLEIIPYTQDNSLGTAGTALTLTLKIQE